MMIPSCPVGDDAAAPGVVSVPPVVAGAASVVVSATTSVALATGVDVACCTAWAAETRAVRAAADCSAACAA